MDIAKCTLCLRDVPTEDLMKCYNCGGLTCPDCGIDTNSGIRHFQCPRSRRQKYG